jgi:acetyl esterase/lipase
MSLIHGFSRRQWLAHVAASGVVLSLGAHAANYPDKAIRIIVPFAPGAGTDAMGRLLAQKLGELLNVSSVVENRTGASGAIGSQFVAQSPADGYTLLLVAAPYTTVPAVLPTAGYDPLRDEGRAYADKLSAAGVPTQYICFERQIHGFVPLGRILDEANTAVKLCAQALRDRF